MNKAILSGLVVTLGLVGGTSLIEAKNPADGLTIGHNNGIKLNSNLRVPGDLQPASSVRVQDTTPAQRTDMVGNHQPTEIASHFQPTSDPQAQNEGTE